MTGLQTMQNFVLLDLKDDFFSMLFHPFYLLPQILELDLRYPVTGECWCYQSLCYEAMMKPIEMYLRSSQCRGKPSPG